MYKNLRTIVTICARGGSKGVPGKNVRPLLGTPLVAYTIKQALSLKWADRIIVSTDDKHIKSIAEECGLEVPFLRPANLALDKSPKVPSIIHAVMTAEKHWHENFDLILDLDPTTPLRLSEDIVGVLEALLSNPKAISSFSVTPAYKNPYVTMVESDIEGFAKIVKKPKQPIGRRQDAPQVYEIVGSAYAIHRSFLEGISYFPTEKNAFYVMPEDRSIDIDREIDFEIIEFLMKKRSNLNKSSK